MTIYVDALLDHGFILRGHHVRSCHLFCDTADLQSLHRMAERIGMKREWFQGLDISTVPHYDLVAAKRDLAVILGAVPVTREQAVAVWQRMRPIWQERKHSASHQSRRR